jgi:hypothetical protein
MGTLDQMIDLTVWHETLVCWLVRERRKNQAIPRNRTTPEVLSGQTSMLKVFASSLRVRHAIVVGHPASSTVESEGQQMPGRHDAATQTACKVILRSLVGLGQEDGGRRSIKWERYRLDSEVHNVATPRVVHHVSSYKASSKQEQALSSLL